MLTPIEGAHARVGLGPNAEIFELGVSTLAGCHHFIDVPPVHECVVDGARSRVCGQTAEHIG